MSKTQKGDFIKEKKIKEYEKLLENFKNENELQEFLEKNTQFIYIPFLLNHGIHFQAIISKFQLNQELITDFVYITKSSTKWRIVLYEIERPDKKLFKIVDGKIYKTAEFESGLGQIDSWKDYIKKYQDEIRRKLEPLLEPLAMKQNDIEFKYCLIIGRHKELNENKAKMDRFNTIHEQNDIEIKTFDSLLSFYRESEHEKILNVINYKDNKYHIKYFHRDDLGSMLAYLRPSILQLNKQQVDNLKQNGYSIDKWKEGELLSYNEKFTKDDFFKQVQQNIEANKYP